MTAWIESGGLLLVAGGLAVAGSVVRGGQWWRAALALAGIAAAADAVVAGRGPAPLALALLLTLVNAIALIRMRGRGPIDGEAGEFHRRHLASLPASDARLLIDQGSFIDARPGEVLTRTGEPVDNLYFLVSGLAAAQIGDAIIGRVRPGDLIGETALLDDGRASATVRIADETARLWFIPRDRLRAFLAVQPRIATALNAATMAGLRDKLEHANRARAGE